MTACLAASSLLAVSGCASTPPSGWQIEPVIQAANGPHFFENHCVDRDDVTFATELVKSDTSGGLWVTSAGTWIHINHAGDKPTPFNESRTATSFVAEDTTRLIVAVNSMEDETNSLYRFDTRKRTWTSLLSTKEWLGDVALMSNGTILFTVFPGGIPYPAYPQPFEIRTLTPDGTNTGGFTRSNDGHVVPLPTPSRTNIAASPVIAANGRGDLISSIAKPAHNAARRTIIGGSDEARSMLVHLSWQDTESELSLTKNGSTTLLPFTRGAVAATWLDEITLVFVIGGGGDASVIAKTTIPSR